MNQNFNKRNINAGVVMAFNNPNTRLNINGTRSNYKIYMWYDGENIKLNGEGVFVCSTFKVDPRFQRTETIKQATEHFYSVLKAATGIHQ